MKRYELKKGKEAEGYEMDLSELYEVTFKKDFGEFKSGDKDYISLPVAMKYVKSGIVENTQDITDAAKKAKCEHLILNVKNDKKNNNL